MAWKIEFAQKAEKAFKKLDRTAQQKIDLYIQKYISTDPLNHGENLKANLRGLRRYRVGDYRIVCEVHEEVLTILVVKVGHRKDIYQ